VTTDTGTAPASPDEAERGGQQGQREPGAASWRGVATEAVDEVSAPLEALLRARSRRLLGELLRPHRRTVALTATAIVIASLAALAGPWLIGVAIDSGIPPLFASGNAAPLLTIAALFAVTVVLQALATRTFVTLTGRFGQAVVLELRRRLFAHMLRLPVSFHESYTSGRVISRQTSDVDAISELFDEGLDGLITAVLSCVLVGTGMLLLDWPPPGPPPGYGPPGPGQPGYGYPARKLSRGLLIALGSAGVAVIAAVVAVIAVVVSRPSGLVNPSPPDVGSYQIVAPTQIDGATLDTQPGIASTFAAEAESDGLTQEFPDYPATVGGAYLLSNGITPLFNFVGAYGALSDVSGAESAAWQGISSEIGAYSDLAAYPPGPLGGSLQCAEAGTGVLQTSVCVWVDHNSVVELQALQARIGTPAAMAALTLSFRQQTEVPR
jgi:ABC-type multidrug transport system fused ATPase/permease subunit